MVESRELHFAHPVSSKYEFRLQKKFYYRKQNITIQSDKKNHISK